MEINNPFKGPQPYNEHDIIYGRDTEIDKLYECVRLNTLTLFYAKSGFGKTSLLKAGLMNKLKESLHYVPVYIRINSLYHKSSKDLQQLISQQLKAFVEENNNRNSHTINFDERRAAEADTVFEYIYSISLTAVNELHQDNVKAIAPDSHSSVREYPLIPVLIFDQYEEIFTILKDNPYKDTLLNDLQCLLEDELPASLEKKIESSEDKEQILFFSKLTDRVSSKDKLFKIIFSFREEFLINLETLKEAIPSIIYTNGRFRLEPFSLNEACSVITNISKGKVSKEVSHQLSELIAQENPTFSVDARKSISPFILSLVSYELYPDIYMEKEGTGAKAAEKQKEIIDRLKKRGKERITEAIDNYYTKAFSEVSSDTKKFIEEELVSKDDKRTLFPFNGIFNYYNADEKNKRLVTEVTQLIENPSKRYLSKNDYLDSPHLEILHDQLLPPVIASRNQRKEEEKIRYETAVKRAKQRKRNTLLIIGSLLLVLVIITGFYFISHKKTVNLTDEFARNEESQVLESIENNYGPYLSFLQALNFYKRTKGFLLTNLPSDKQLDALLKDSILAHYYHKNPLWGSLDTSKVTGFTNYGANAFVSPNSAVALSFNSNEATIVELDNLQSFKVHLPDNTALQLPAMGNGDSAAMPNFYGQITYNAAFSKSFIALTTSDNLYVLDRKNKYALVSATALPSNPIKLFYTLNEAFIIMETNPIELTSSKARINAHYYIFFDARGNKIGSFTLQNEEPVNIVQKTNSTKSELKIIAKQTEESGRQRILEFSYPVRYTATPTTIFESELPSAAQLAYDNPFANKPSFIHRQRYFFRKNENNNWLVYDAKNNDMSRMKMGKNFPENSQPLSLVKSAKGDTIIVTTAPGVFIQTKKSNSEIALNLPAIAKKNPSDVQVQNIILPEKNNRLIIAYSVKQNAVYPSAPKTDSLYVSVINLENLTATSSPYPITDINGTSMYLFNDSLAMVLPVQQGYHLPPYIVFIKKPLLSNMLNEWNKDQLFGWGEPEHFIYAYTLPELRKMKVNVQKIKESNSKKLALLPN